MLTDELKAQALKIIENTQESYFNFHCHKPGVWVNGYYTCYGIPQYLIPRIAINASNWEIQIYYGDTLVFYAVRQGINKETTVAKTHWFRKPTTSKVSQHVGWTDWEIQVFHDGEWSKWILVYDEMYAAALAKYNQEAFTPLKEQENAIDR